MLGKTLPGCPHPYCFALDFDGDDAVAEFFGSWEDVQSRSKKTRIEWHQDKGSIHIVLFSEKHDIARHLVEKLDNGDISVKYAYEMVKRSNDHNEIKNLPEGQFDIILADPPWTYEFPNRGSPQDHYQTMSLEDIKSMKIPSADNAILFLWATISKNDAAFEVMKSWGFT